jgi:hypothetical protein
MAELERELLALEVEWPETPDIATAVLVRLEAEAEPAPAPRARRPVRRPVRRAPALVAGYGLAALLAALAVTMAVSPAARSAILELLGLKGARIERREPTAPPPPATRAPLGADLGLGTPRTLARARDEAGYPLLVPAREPLGAPDAVYVTELPYTGGVAVSLVYGSRPGIPRSRQTGAALLFQQFPASVDRNVIGKATGAGARVEPVQVDGERGYFISGAPHGFAYLGEDGNAGFQEQRLAGNTLLLEHGDLLLRVEGEVSRAEAVAIARSAR